MPHLRSLIVEFRMTLGRLTKLVICAYEDVMPHLKSLIIEFRRTLGPKEFIVFKRTL